MLRMLRKNDGVWGVLVGVILGVMSMVLDRPWSFITLVLLILYVVMLMILQARMANTIKDLISASDSMVRQMQQTNVVLAESRKALEELNGHGEGEGE